MTRKSQIQRQSPIQKTLRYTKTPAFKATSRRFERHASQKKPRKKELTDAEKLNKRKLSQVRVRVKHAISGVKRSRIVKDVFRNTKDDFSNLVRVIACGLHNLRVQQRTVPLNVQTKPHSE